MPLPHAIDTPGASATASAAAAPRRCCRIAVGYTIAHQQIRPAELLTRRSCAALDPARGPAFKSYWLPLLTSFPAELRS